MEQCYRPWTSSVAAAHVKTYPWLERVPDLPVSAPAFLWNRYDS